MGVWPAPSTTTGVFPGPSSSVAALPDGSVSVGGWPADSRSSGVFPAGSRLVLPPGTVPQMPQYVTVDFDGSGELTVALVSGDPVRADFDGTGDLTLDVVEVDSRTAVFDGSGALAVEVVEVYELAVAFDGVGELTASVYDGASVQPVDVAFDGAGELTASTLVQHAVDVAFDGTGVLSVDVVEQYAVDVTFAGSGDLGLQTVEVEAVAVGYGSIGTLSLDVVEVHQVAVSFGGTGDLTTVVEARQPAFVGSATALNATSIALPAHKAGDILIVASMSQTAPSAPAGWTTATFQDPNNQIRGRIGWKVATSSSETSGTWTNGYYTLAMVYRGFTGATLNTTVGTGSNPNFPSLAGGGWVMRMAIWISNTSPAVPSGYARRADRNDSSNAVRFQAFDTSIAPAPSMSLTTNPNYGIWTGASIILN